MPLSLPLRIRLEKAAADNGFDVALGPDGDWLVFGSSHAPLRLWLTEWAETMRVAALSNPAVCRALGEHGVAISNPLPAGAAGARGVADFTQLHRLLRRALLLARTLPNALYEAYAASTADMPRATEAQRLVVQRVGQDLFRAGLMDFWDGRCAISGLALPQLLRASHIQPWADCARDEERLDVFNGLLLAAHLDAAFDAGLMTLEDDGQLVLADALDGHARAVLGVEAGQRVKGIAEGHRRYLAWHRGRVFGKRQ